MCQIYRLHSLQCDWILDLLYLALWIILSIVAHSWTLLKLRHSICSNYRVFQKKLSTFTRKFPILISSYLTCRIESIGHNMLTNAVHHHLKALTNVRARIWSAHIQWIVREISLKWCLWYYLLFDKFYRLWTNQIKLITSLEPCSIILTTFSSVWFGMWGMFHWILAWLHAMQCILHLIILMWAIPVYR